MTRWVESLNARKQKQRRDRKPLTVTSPLLVEQTGFTEAPPLSASVRHHPSLSSFTVQQGVHQDLQTEGYIRWHVLPATGVSHRDSFTRRTWRPCCCVYCHNSTFVSNLHVSLTWMKSFRTALLLMWLLIRLFPCRKYGLRWCSREFRSKESSLPSLLL